MNHLDVSLKNDADQPRLAVLIDAENTSTKYIDAIMIEIASLGVIVVKRVYGDFSHPSLNIWKAKAQAHGLAPVHCFRSVSGKSNSDMALAIDAMDWLHSGRIDGICLITSDSDFAPLAVRIKEGGRLTYGFGRQITPKSFVNAVNRFVYVETLMDEDTVSPAVQAPSASTPMTPVAPAAPAVSVPSGVEPVAPDDATLRTNALPAEKPAVMTQAQAEAAILIAIGDLTQSVDWINLASVGHLMVKRFPDFSPMNYRVKKLATFVERIAGVEMRRDQETRLPFVRLADDAHHARRAPAAPVAESAPVAPTAPEHAAPAVE